MSRLIVITLVLYLFSACASYRPACKTKAGKKKLEYYNSIQYKSAKKYTKNKSSRKRMASY